MILLDLGHGYSVFILINYSIISLVGSSSTHTSVIIVHLDLIMTDLLGDLMAMISQLQRLRWIEREYRR